MVRELPERIDASVGFLARRAIPRKSRRAISAAMEELLHSRMLGEVEEGGTIGLMMFLSTVRDDYPWLYELGVEFQRAIQSGTKTQIQKTLAQMHRVIEFTMHGPMSEAGPDDKEIAFVLRRLHEAIERIAKSALSKRTPRLRAIRAEIADS